MCYLHVHLLLTSVMSHGITHLELSHLSLHLRWPWLPERLRWGYRQSKVAERAWVAVASARGGRSSKYKILHTWGSLPVCHMNTNKTTNTNQTMEWLSKRAGSGRLLPAYKMSRYWWEKKLKKCTSTNSIHAHSTHSAFRNSGGSDPTANHRR